MSYQIHSIETAPEKARQDLIESRNAFGFVPNLLGVMANAPPLLEGYRLMDSLFEETSLSSTERQVVLLTTSCVNACAYCIAAHTVAAERERVPAYIVDAIRSGQPLPDQKLDALRRFTAEMTISRGWPSDARMRAFYGAGYSRATALEVVLGICLKSIANYTNHLAQTPLDEAFKQAACDQEA